MAIGPVHEREKEDPTGKEGGQREDSVHFVQKGVLLLQLNQDSAQRHKRSAQFCHEDAADKEVPQVSPEPLGNWHKDKQNDCVVCDHEAVFAQEVSEGGEGVSAVLVSGSVPLTEVHSVGVIDHVWNQEPDILSGKPVHAKAEGTEMCLSPFCDQQI